MTLTGFLLSFLGGCVVGWGLALLRLGRLPQAVFLVLVGSGLSLSGWAMNWTAR